MRNTLDETDLARAGVEVVDESRLLLRCRACGSVWSPMLEPDGGGLPVMFRRCPVGCNIDEAEFAEAALDE